MTVLLGSQPIDAIKEHCTVVVRYKVCFPRLEQFFFQLVDYVCCYQTHVHWSQVFLLPRHLTSKLQLAPDRQWNIYFWFLSLQTSSRLASTRTCQPLLRWWNYIGLCVRIGLGLLVNVTPTIATFNSFVHSKTSSGHLYSRPLILCFHCLVLIDVSWLCCCERIFSSWILWYGKWLTQIDFDRRLSLQISVCNRCIQCSSFHFQTLFKFTES